MSSLNARLFSNSFYLALIQAANLGLPLLTFPYLVRILGIELFGVLALATAVMHYANVLIDYGFNLTAARQVAQDRNNREALSALFSRVQLIKLCLTMICVTSLGGVQLFTSWLGDYTLLYWVVLAGVVATALFPVWLFQGMERMRTVSILNVATKAVFTVGIFVLVQAPEDYLFSPLLFLLGAIFTLLLGCYLAFKQFDLIWVWPSMPALISQLRESWYVFLSQLKVTLFSNTNVVILGAFAGPVSVGYYAGAEKLMRALAQLQTPVTQALFPQISQLMVDQPSLAFQRLRKVMLVGVLVYLALLVVVFALADWFCVLLFAEDGVMIATLLRWMLPIPLCIFLNNIFGTQILLNQGRDRVFFWVLMIVAIFRLVICSILADQYQHYGAAVALLMTEVVLVSVFAWLVKADVLKKSYV